MGEDFENYRPRRALPDQPDFNDDDFEDDDFEDGDVTHRRDVDTVSTENDAPKPRRSRISSDGTREHGQGNQAQPLAVTPPAADGWIQPEPVGPKPTVPRSTVDVRRRRLPLWIGAVAAAVVIIVGVVYAAHALLSKPSADPQTHTSSQPSQQQSSTQPAAILSPESMLSETDAKLVDPNRSWQASLTQTGIDDNSPLPVCLQSSTEGQPTPELSMVRTLTATGKNPPTVLHQADAYPSPEEATQAFTGQAGQLGECQLEGAYLVHGIVVADLGNQATGVVVQVGADKPTFHTVLLSRTGSIVNIIEVAQLGTAPSVAALGRASAKVTNDQCTAAVGLCSSGFSVTTGPPPLGGDVPGFLTAADIPPISKSTGSWGGTDPISKPDVSGSQCEAVNFASVAGTTKAAAQRTYLMHDDPQAPDTLGLDEIIWTMKDAKAADALVSKVSHNVSTCGKRQLTATISKPVKVTGQGANATGIAGSAFTVVQEIDKKTKVTYRVGILSAGSKVVYTFLSPGDDFDFTDEQWDNLNVRAGQRASQIK